MRTPIRFGTVKAGRESYTMLYDPPNRRLVLVYVLGHRALTFLNSVSHTIQSAALTEPVDYWRAREVSRQTLERIGELRSLGIRQRFAIDLGLRDDPGGTLDALLRETPTRWKELGYQANADEKHFLDTMGRIVSDPTHRFFYRARYTFFGSEEVHAR